MPSTTPPGKTLVVCCDGTWVNAIGKDGSDAPASNVSRLITALCKTCPATGRPQVALYHPGVGTSGQLLDVSMGGAFGLGLDQDIRDMYQFLCLNYEAHDSIVLVGFSRGAFTARSVADLVASVGLLTPDGQDRFDDIFDDYENMADVRRDAGRFLCPIGTLAPFSGEQGDAWVAWEDRRKTQYRAWLKTQGYTRDAYGDGESDDNKLTIKAVAVWDTVGSLGIPAVPVIGLKGSAAQWKFTNTHISPRVENAFQALALDEPRYDFLPSLWERLPDNTTTHLRQVWFPGAHANVGGGYRDQQIANLTLAWMCDQLAGPRVRLAFDAARLAAIFADGLRYSAAHPLPNVPFFHDWPFASPPASWATKYPTAAAPRDTLDCPGKYAHPHADGAPALLWARGARPWALGQTRMPTSLAQRAAGKAVRRPAHFVRVDPVTNDARPAEPLLNTNERIHASVRVRLACGGLGMDDTHVWTCPGLTGVAAPDDDDPSAPLWRLECVDAVADVADVGEGNDNDNDPDLYPLAKVAGAGRWQWVFAQHGQNEAAKAGKAGKARRADPHSNNPMPANGPPVHILPEELPTGRWERLLLGMTVGSPDVLAWAAANPYQSSN